MPEFKSTICALNDQVTTAITERRPFGWPVPKGLSFGTVQFSIFGFRTFAQIAHDASDNAVSGPTRFE